MNFFLSDMGFLLSVFLQEEGKPQSKTQSLSFRIAALVDLFWTATLIKTSYIMEFMKNAEMLTRGAKYTLFFQRCNF